MADLTAGSIPASPFARAAAAYPDMTCRQVAILTAIVAAPGGSNREYARPLGYSAPVITRAADAMAALGLIDRKKSAQDGRCVVLTATPAGIRFLASLDGPAATLAVAA